MKAKKLMRWTLALTLTGVGAALAVITLDAWTGSGATAPPSASAAPALVVTTSMPVVSPAPDSPAPDSPVADPQVTGTITESAISLTGPPGGLSRTDPTRSLEAPRSGGDETVMLAAAPPVPGSEVRLLEQIETARAGLVAAHATVPARPAGQAAWLPVAFLAGGGGLIGCAFGLGLGSLFLRRRASANKSETTARAAASARDPRPVSLAVEDSAEAVVRAARAELAARAAGDRGGSPAVCAAPGAAARGQALSRMAAAHEFAAAGPSVASTPSPAVPVAASSVRDETIRSHAGLFGFAPRRRKASVPAVSAHADVCGPASGSPSEATARVADAQSSRPTDREGADPVDRRIAALERSLIHVVRAMEEVAERVADRGGAPVSPHPGARVPASNAGEDRRRFEQAGPLVTRGHSEDDEDLERDALAPPARSPRRREREARPRVTAASLPVAAARSFAPVPSGSAAPPARPAQSVVRAVRALRAARDQAPAVPEPWDLSAASAAPSAVEVTDRQESAPSMPSASTADGRDLVRIRRAVLRLAAEGWDSGRIAGQLRLGEGDVSLIVKTAGAERRLQPAGQGR